MSSLSSLPSDQDGPAAPPDGEEGGDGVRLDPREPYLLLDATEIAQLRAVLATADRPERFERFNLDADRAFLVLDQYDAARMLAAVSGDVHRIDPGILSDLTWLERYGREFG
jgi:hypothetical protein